jgi:uncharacterized membrane protein
MTTDADIERALGRVLTLGTRLSTVMLGLGLAATFVAPGHALTGVLLASGLLVLLLTPVARVVVSIVGYVRERDWWFVLYTGIVLALLIGSFVAAFR